MRRLVLIAAPILLFALLLSACAQAPAPSMSAPAPTIYQVPRPATSPAPAPAPPTLQDKGAAVVTSASSERMIVRTGNMFLVVKDVLDTRDKIAQLAQELGGFVVSSSISGQDENVRGSVSVRVPDEKFDQALSRLGALAVRVRSESTNSQDVTEEYIDLQARLKNSQATEAQYLALLSKTTTVEETLKIYDALSRVRSEIEQMKGRIQYLERTVSMSLISINLEPETTLKSLAPVGWNPPAILNAAIRGLVTFGQWLGTLAIWLLIFIPVWGVIGGIVYWRLHARRKPR